jgi:hypothetical protein
VRRMLLLGLVLVTGCPLGTAARAAFPPDGKFKMQPLAQDRWYYYDDIHWYIKAPDKWQHLMGSYASTKILRRALGDDVTAASAVLIGGVLKELDDALREGWSVRDLMMDFMGVSAAVFDTPSVRFLGAYDQERFVMTLNFRL